MYNLNKKPHNKWVWCQSKIVMRMKIMMTYSLIWMDKMMMIDNKSSYDMILYNHVLNLMDAELMQYLMPPC